MKKLQLLLKRVDENLIKYLLIFFVFFIPLFPKVPLFRFEYTYVFIRPDDFFIVVINLVFLVQLLRKKVQLNKEFFIIFCLFFLSVFISILNGIYITKTLPYHQIAFLHGLRRIEYMSIFFIAYASITKIKDFYLLLFSYILSFFIVNIYGIGQRFLGFPAISTMNPEFARGHVLFLTPEARLASTFSGHYDYAIYLVFSIPIIWGVFFLFETQLRKNYLTLHSILGTVIKKIMQIKENITLKLSQTYTLPTLKQLLLLHIPIGLCIVLITYAFRLKTGGLFIFTNLFLSSIIFTVSFSKYPRSSLLITYIIAFFTLMLTASRASFLAYLFSTPFLFLILKKYKYFIIVTIISVLLFATNSTMRQRFAQTFQVQQFLVNEKTGEIYVLQKIGIDMLPAGSQPLVKLNKYQTSTESQQVKRQVLKDLERKKRLAGNLDGINEDNYKEVTAVAPDISFSTRLKVEWPRAISAFLSNPILGKGPSSITESTDNDYLRWLGELGLFGTVLFVIILYRISKKITQFTFNNKFFLPLGIGFLIGFLALLINALYIDVFEASKIAYLFWFITGIYSGVIDKYNKTT